MCFCLERFGLSADLEPPRGASSLERISLAEAYEQMWAKVITKDLSDETVLETETLRAKSSVLGGRSDVALSRLVTPSCAKTKSAGMLSK